MKADWDAILTAPCFSLGVKLADEGRLGEIVFLPPGEGLAPSRPLAVKTAAQLTAWLKDPDTRFDLPLAIRGTAFRQRVWTQISAIPRGETRTYGDLARALSSAPQAVGQACGDNPFPIIVPCHRVVAAGGALGGFAHNQGDYLLQVKAWLLAHERC